MFTPKGRDVDVSVGSCEVIRPEGLAELLIQYANKGVPAIVEVIGTRVAMLKRGASTDCAVLRLILNGEVVYNELVLVPDYMHPKEDQ